MTGAKQLARYQDLTILYHPNREKPYFVAIQGTVFLENKFKTFDEAEQCMITLAFLRHGELICRKITNVN